MESGTFIDTHVLIWISNGDIHKISEKAKALLERSQFYVSPISILEIDYLHEIGKYDFSGHRFLVDFNKKEPLTIPEDPFFKVIQESSKITWTRDVFDRILVAHAKLHNAPLITKDEKIRTHYKKAVW